MMMTTQTCSHSPETQKVVLFTRHGTIVIQRGGKITQLEIVRQEYCVQSSVNSGLYI